MDNVAKNKPIVRTSEVIGVNIFNTNDEKLGEVFEIVLDKVSGQVKYAVLTSGGMLGLGNKLLALPWKILKYNDNKDAFVINLSKDNLERAPGFDKDNWPVFTDEKWISTITDFYDTIGR